jgi:protein-tyrosine phosphatase
VDITHSKNEIPYTLYVPADDHESFDISKYFQQAGSFISDCLSRTNIMVHCLAGVSRSVSLVLGYFIQHKGMTYSQAYDLVKSRRKIIHPNDGFIASLKKLEQICRSSSPPRERYSPSPARPTYSSQQAHY